MFLEHYVPEPLRGGPLDGLTATITSSTPPCDDPHPVITGNRAHPSPAPINSNLRIEGVDRIPVSDRTRGKKRKPVSVEMDRIRASGQTRGKKLKPASVEMDRIRMSHRTCGKKRKHASVEADLVEDSPASDSDFEDSRCQGAEYVVEKILGHKYDDVSVVANIHFDDVQQRIRLVGCTQMENQMGKL